MKEYFLILVIILCYASCNGNKGISTNCNVSLNDKLINFSSCYNGLTISELIIEDSNFAIYPLRYKKYRVYELVEKIPLKAMEIENVVINYRTPDKRFVWRIYENVEGHLDNDLYSGNKYRVLDSLGSLFLPNTWYLFNFFNPHFQLFIYSDSSLKLKMVKRDLNANF